MLAMYKNSPTIPPKQHIEIIAMSDISISICLYIIPLILREKISWQTILMRVCNHILTMDNKLPGKIDKLTISHIPLVNQIQCNPMRSLFNFKNVHGVS